MPSRLKKKNNREAAPDDGNIGWCSMKDTHVYFLIVGVPGLFFLIAGAVSHEYLVAALGGVLVIVSADRFNRKQAPRTPLGNYKKHRLSFGLASVIGASLAITGFVSDGIWIGMAGVVILIGSLLQLYRTILSNGR